MFQHRTTFVVDGSTPVRAACHRRPESDFTSVDVGPSVGLTINAKTPADLLAFARRLVAALEPLGCAEPGCSAAPFMDSVDYCVEHSAMAEVAP